MEDGDPRRKLPVRKPIFGGMELNNPNSLLSSPFCYKYRWFVLHLSRGEHCDLYIFPRSTELIQENEQGRCKLGCAIFLGLWIRVSIGFWV